ncbi:MAG: prolyl oligopeptidase family serine peptidase [Sulfurovum sp.]|nr:prolyl oligopeptidase family serine peptidase [Sulfurovum sp.]
MSKHELPKSNPKTQNTNKNNHERIDNYYWLNDREDSEVIDYLHAENTYTKEKLASTEDLQKELFDEIVAKIVKDDSSVPYESNGYWYYARYEEGKDYPIYCRKKEYLAADEVIILDVNVLAEGHAYYSVGGLSISPDNAMLCYGVDNISRRIYTLYFKNLETGEVLEECIKNTTGSATWANDNNTLFFTQMEAETLRAYKIFRYEMGSCEEVEIYHEVDDTYGVHVSKSKSKKFLFIESYSTLSTEVQTLSADEPMGDFQVFAKRERDLEYSVEHHDDKFVIATNLEAKNFRLMHCDLEHTSKEHWKELIAHREDVLLEGFELFNDFLVLEEKKNGLTQIYIKNTKTEESYYLDFAEAVYDAYISMNLDFDTNELCYGYNSLTTPNSTLRFNMLSKEKTVLKETEILGDFNKEDYESKRAWVRASDGKRIPLSLVYKKGLVLDGTNPTLQYAYGSYGYSMDASFSLSRLSLLDRGFVFAIAHIRGGEELGRAWYEEGKLLTKMNTFTDFIACSEYLNRRGIYF